MRGAAPTREAERYGERTPADPGAQGPAGEHAPQNGGAAGPWPQGVSRTASMSIGALVRELQKEFPAVTVSKVRFLEEQGLVTPTRTGSGYRKYSPADTERLRYALTRQRDAYLPLRVIRDELDDLDAGRGVVPEPVVRVIARDGRLVAPEPHERVSVTRVCELTGASEDQLDELVSAGLITTDTRGRLTGRAVPIVAAAVSLREYGLSPRHLRSVRLGAEREADTIETVVAPLLAKRHGAGRERGAAQAAELAKLYSDLHSALLRQALDHME